MKKGIIFDVDGTLWDASAQVVDSWNEVLSMHPGLDVSITVEDMNNNMGKTMDELGRAFFPSFSHEERTRFMKECMEYENRYLVCNCQSGYIEVLLKTSGLGEYIKDMECFGNTGLPKGDNIRMVVQRNHLDRCIYVGDTSMDQEAAALAGVPFVHAAYGYGSADAPEGSIDSMEQLPETAKQMLG